MSKVAVRGGFLVLRPTIVANVAADEAAEALLLVPNRDQHSLAVEVGDAALRTAMGKPGIHELVAGEALNPHRGHETVRTCRRVAHLVPAGVSL